MIKALLRCLRLERLFERWLGMRGGDFEGRIYEALWVGCVLGFAAGAPKALEDLPGKEILQRLNGVFEALDRDLQRIANELEQALACADEGVAPRYELNASQRQLAPLQAVVWPDSRARTGPPNLPCCLRRN